MSLSLTLTATWVASPPARPHPATPAQHTAANRRLKPGLREDRKEVGSRAGTMRSAKGVQRPAGLALHSDRTHARISRNRPRANARCDLRPAAGAPRDD